MDKEKRAELFEVIEQGLIERAAKLLKSKKVDCNIANETGRTLLMLACLSAKLGMVQLVVERGEKGGNFKINAVNKEGCSALTCAANDGLTEICAYLITKGAHVDHSSSSGSTPLMHACFNGHTQVVNLLLTQGANVDAQSVDGWTPLLYASDAGYRDIVDLLLDRGANTNCQSKKGWTAVMCAAHRGRDEVVVALLKHRADPNIKNYDQCTPLMWAACNGHISTCRLLLAGHAMLALRDRNGLTAIDVARKKQQDEVAQFLENEGIKKQLLRREGSKLIWLDTEEEAQKSLDEEAKEDNAAKNTILRQLAADRNAKKGVSTEPNNGLFGFLATPAALASTRSQPSYDVIPDNPPPFVPPAFLGLCCRSK